ncbi:helix-turn-helix domain-containing protein [Paenibacillus antri]|uniref:Helix-turn-helix domain-containing protein n=1 Tax=Paenibacillus antri TaxID=2582848 RepID=A0A5R9GIE8_9BACL|nr:helix-turn-helix domain-containing protein [Paenibacillus antri]TLS54286.1 helix-turn-helix domain-containing protein [Paenibacillus antri]
MMNASWFRRLLLSYLPVFFIVTSILFFLFIQAFNEQNRREALKANEFLASQVVQYLDNSLRSIDYKVLREMLTNQNLKNYFAPGLGNPVLDAIQAVDVIDELKIDFPLIHSIYLVRYHDGTVLSNGKTVPIDAFPDAAFIEESRKRNAQKWTGARNFQAFSSEAGVPVVTLVRPMGADADGLVVVNVGLASLKSSITRMYDPGYTFVDVLGPSGERLWNEAATGEASRGSGAGEIFSEFTSSYTGWKVQTGLNNGKVVKFALQFYNVWFAVAIAVVFIGVAWVVYVTRRNYKPIEQIVTLIETFATQKKSNGGQAQGNELRFIHTTLEGMMQQTKQYQQQYADNLILQKKYFFQELLEGTKRYDEAEWKAEMKKLNLPVLGDRWTVAVVEIDRYRKFTEEYHRQDQSLLKFILSSVLQEVAQQEGTDAWAEWISDRRLYAIVWLSDDREAEELEKKLFASYKDWVEQNLNLTVTVGVGLAASDLEGLRFSFKEAAYAMEFKAALGMNRVILRDDAPEPHNDLFELLKTISLFVQAMRLSDEEWEAHFDRLFRQIAESVLSRQEIVNTMQLLVQHYEREFADLSREYQELWAESLDRLLRRLEDWETVDDLRERCLDVFRDLAEQMQTIRQSKGHRSLILQIRKYIEENYGNPDLSLNYLSDKFDINPKYLSKLFKDEIGEKFLDLLISQRIEKAKQLMQETDKPIQEISEEVGYTNYNSFNRAFKNVVGVSPSDYRKQL